MSEGKLEKVEGELASHVLRREIDHRRSRISRVNEPFKPVLQSSIEIAIRMLQYVDSNLRLSSYDAIDVCASIRFLAINHLENKKKIADMLKIKWPPYDKDSKEMLIDERGV